MKVPSRSYCLLASLARMWREGGSGEGQDTCAGRCSAWRETDVKRKEANIGIHNMDTVLDEPERGRSRPRSSRRSFGKGYRTEGKIADADEALRRLRGRPQGK